MSWFRRTPQKPRAVALDIGTEFVKVLVFEVDEQGGTVIGQGRERQRLSDMHGGAVSDIPGVIATANRALQSAFEEAHANPDQAIVGIAGELVKGTTSSTITTRKQPKKPMSEQELKDIIATAQKEVLFRSRRDLAQETGYAEIDVQLVSSAVVSVTIDGYRVSNAIGFQGRQVEVGIYTSYAPTVHLGAVQTIVEGLGLDLISIATEPYAVARCFGSQESGDVSSIFIDVGGGTTDIAVVRTGGLEGTKMFALGGRVFTKRIASHLKVPFYEAEEIKLAYSQGNLDNKDMGRVKAFISGDVEVWLSGVELALEEFISSDRFTDNKLLPSKIYLCGGGSLLPDLMQALEQKKWMNSLPFAKQPEVQYIKPGQVSSIHDATKTLSSTQDVTPMALANIALDLVGSEAPASSLWTRLLKSLRA